MSLLTQHRDREEDERRLFAVRKVLNLPHLEMDKTNRLVMVIPCILDDKDRLAIEQLGATSSYNVFTTETTIQMPRSRMTDLLWLWTTFVYMSWATTMWFLGHVILLLRQYKE